MTEIISLGGVEFNAIQVINQKESLVLPAHKIEEGYEIADHAEEQPVEFTVDIELLKDKGEPEKLNAIFSGKELICFVSELGVFDDMEIQDKSYTQGGNISTIKASIHLKQIRKAIAKITTIDLPITPTEEAMKGGDSAVPPVESENPAAKGEEPEEKKSWVETITGWFSKE
jgi:hypothetical protein